MACRRSHIVAEPEQQRYCAQLHNLGQGEVDGCGAALPDKRRLPVLQGVGGDAVGGLVKSSNGYLHRVAKYAILIPSYPQKRV